MGGGGEGGGGRRGCSCRRGQGVGGGGAVRMRREWEVGVPGARRAGRPNTREFARGRYWAWSRSCHTAVQPVGGWKGGADCIGTPEKLPMTQRIQ